MNFNHLLLSKWSIQCFPMSLCQHNCFCLFVCFGNVVTHLHPAPLFFLTVSVAQTCWMEGFRHLQRPCWRFSGAGRLHAFIWSHLLESSIKQTQCERMKDICYSSSGFRVRILNSLHQKEVKSQKIRLKWPHPSPVLIELIAFHFLWCSLKKCNICIL